MYRSTNASNTTGTMTIASTMYMRTLIDKNTEN